MRRTGWVPDDEVGVQLREGKSPKAKDSAVQQVRAILTLLRTRSSACTLSASFPHPVHHRMHFPLASAVGIGLLDTGSSEHEQGCSSREHNRVRGYPPTLMAPEILTESNRPLMICLWVGCQSVLM